MNKLFKKYKYFLLIFVVGACSYKPIYSGMNYSFNIGEAIFTGERQINNIIQNRFNLIKEIKGSNQKIYNLQVDTVKKKLIVSNDSKGDPLKFELIVTTNYKIFQDSELLLIKQIEKNNIYNNDTDKFKVQQNEKIILENIADKISETIISSIVNLNDN